MNDANVSMVTYQQMTYQQTGVAYPGVRDDRSTVNTKTGYDDDDDDDVLGCADADVWRSDSGFDFMDEVVSLRLYVMLISQENTAFL